MGLTNSVQESLTKTVTQDTSFSIADPYWMSLHSANPGGSGANEITTGSGAEARQEVAFSGSNGTDANTSAAVVFTIASAVDVTWVGAWTAETGGTFIGGFPLIGQQTVGAGLSGSDSLLVPAHGYSVNDVVRMETIAGITSAVPTGFTADDPYFVKTVVDVDHIILSATMGGSAITPSSSGGFGIALDQSQTFAGAGVLTFPETTGVIYSTMS